MKMLIVILFTVLIWPATLQAGQPVYVAGLESNKDQYGKLVAEKGGNPLTIKDYKSEYASRPAVALLIIQQALNLGEMDAQIIFVTYPNYARCIAELKKGKAHILATDIWEEQFDKTVYKTAPFIRKGEFEKGIYTYNGSALLNSQPVLEDLLNHKPITGLSWKTDQNVLREMGFNKIDTAPTYSLLFKMLTRKRAELTLLEFPGTPDKHYMNDEILHVVKNAKVIFPHSRHFMISKKRPGGEDIYAALEKGLKIMRENGTLNRALHQSGIINERVKDWKVIWPPQNATQQNTP